MEISTAKLDIINDSVDIVIFYFFVTVCYEVNACIKYFDVHINRITISLGDHMGVNPNKNSFNSIKSANFLKINRHNFMTKSCQNKGLIVCIVLWMILMHLKDMQRILRIIITTANI